MKDNDFPYHHPSWKDIQHLFKTFQSGTKFRLLMRVQVKFNIAPFVTEQDHPPRTEKGYQVHVGFF